MLGLDDFVKLSDFVNKNLGISGRQQIMNSTAYSDKFGNFLDIRKRELRITPYSCWTEEFLTHLGRNSIIAKVIFVIHDHNRVCSLVFDVILFVALLKYAVLSRHVVRESALVVEKS